MFKCESETKSKKTKIGITGQKGFIGTHLRNTLKLNETEFEVIEYDRSYFEDEAKLNRFVSTCDCIIHLAALNRDESEQNIYDTNIKLVKALIRSCTNTNSKPHIIFSSSLQEEKNNLYGKSKKIGRDLLSHWSKNGGGLFTGLIIPNVFGPFGKPHYNSVVATFAHQIINNKIPVIYTDTNLKLIYIGELIQTIIEKIRFPKSETFYQVSNTSQIKVSELLKLLNLFKSEYLNKGIIPALKNSFELNLFNTFRSYINIDKHFPVLYDQHSDHRGTFIELIKLNTGGQISFSTTSPGVTRGNHFHTRKIERFSVIKGRALIQLRKIGTNKIFNLNLDGESPAYVDMPIWYTHNIKNIGDETLYTVFWINEFFDPKDTDTFIEEI